MIVKQITMDEALKLAAKGKEIMILVPADGENNWSEMVPDTLQNMLSGVMFFRREPALENPMIDSEGNPPRRQELMERLKNLPEEKKGQPAAVWVPVPRGKRKSR